MALKECLQIAVEGGELHPDDARHLMRRFDELTAAGLSPEDARQTMIAELDARATNGFVRCFEELVRQGRSPAAARAEVIAVMRARGLTQEAINRFTTELGRRAARATVQRMREQALGRAATVPAFSPAHRPRQEALRELEELLLLDETPTHEMGRA